MTTQLTVVKSVINENYKSIRNSLPSHIKPEKFAEVCNVAAMKNPDLLNCTPDSLATAFIQCAKDGLVPDGKEAAIVSYSKKRGNQWVPHAQYQVMVDGLLKKIRQSGEVLRVDAKIVYKDDEFDYFVDLDGDHLIHKPKFGSHNRTKDDIFVVYAMAKTVHNEVLVEVMTMDDIERVMYSSKGAIDRKTGKVKIGTPWDVWFDRMCLKSALHRLGRRLPNSSEVLEMIERDIQIKSFEEQRNEYVNAPQPMQQTNKNDSTINEEKIKELKHLVEATNANSSVMFSWVSSKTQKLSNDYQELTQPQYELLKHELEKKMAKQLNNQTMAAGQQEGAVQGVLV